MKPEIVDQLKAVYRRHLAQGRAFAAVRLARLARERTRLESRFGEAAPEARSARERHDRQQAVVTNMQSRIERLGKARS